MAGISVGWLQGRGWIPAVLGLGFAAVAVLMLRPPVMTTIVAQEVTATPVQLNIPTATATVEFVITVTPSRTPTDYISVVRIEAKDAEVGANVRAGPSTDETRIGNIKPGKFYAVTGRYENWLQILYEDSSTGYGWVYSEIVNVSGGSIDIVPTVDFSALPTANPAAAQMQQTLDYITGTPGALETATAVQAAATGVFVAQQPDAPPVLPGEPLPTFTFPPPFVEATLPTRGTASSTGGLPPIMPIIGLGLLGLAGLFISGLRGLGG